MPDWYRVRSCKYKLHNPKDSKYIHELFSNEIKMSNLSLDYCKQVALSTETRDLQFISPTEERQYTSLVKQWRERKNKSSCSLVCYHQQERKEPALQAITSPDNLTLQSTTNSGFFSLTHSRFTPFLWIIKVYIFHYRKVKCVYKKVYRPGWRGHNHRSSDAFIGEKSHNTGNTESDMHSSCNMGEQLQHSSMGEGRHQHLVYKQKRAAFILQGNNFNKKQPENVSTRSGEPHQHTALAKKTILKVNCIPNTCWCSSEYGGTCDGQ